MGVKGLYCCQKFSRITQFWQCGTKWRSATTVALCKMGTLLQKAFTLKSGKKRREGGNHEDRRRENENRGKNQRDCEREKNAIRNRKKPDRASRNSLPKSHLSRAGFIAKITIINTSVGNFMKFMNNRESTCRCRSGNAQETRLFMIIHTKKVRKCTYHKLNMNDW